MTNLGATKMTDQIHSTQTRLHEGQPWIPKFQDDRPLIRLTEDFAQYESEIVTPRTGRYAGQTIEMATCASLEEGRWEFFVSIVNVI